MHHCNNTQNKINTILSLSINFNLPDDYQLILVHLASIKRK